jgi:hypothetical protein
VDKNKATYEVLLLQSEASGLEKIEAMAFLSNQGVPLEVLTRMDSLWEQTAMVVNQVLHIGKIIIMKLIQFIRENPNMLIGLAVGIGLGILSASVPFIGIFIAPVITVVFSVMGILRGHRLDKVMSGECVGDSLIEDAITIIKKFWCFFYEIFNVVVVDPIIG